MNLLNLTIFELKKLLVSKSTWILLAIFVCLANISAFFMGGFLLLNQASLKSFLQYAPLSIALFAFLVSFNSNSKESKKANRLKLASLPLDLRKLTLAKFAANSTLASIFLLLCSGFIATIIYLGSPDYSLMVSGLFACILFFKLCFAITSFTNTFSRSSFESLGFSILIMFVLCLNGFGAVAQLLATVFPDTVVAGITKYSILNSYANIATGFIGLSDIVLFVSLIAMFLASSIIYTNKSIHKIDFGKTKLIVISIFTLIINSAFYNSSIKFDLTSDKVYSISQNLLNIVNKIDKPVTLTFYYSKSNPNVPREFARHAEYVEKYLSQLQNKSNNKIKVVVKDPELSETTEVAALKNKIAAIPLPNADSMYAGISIKSGKFNDEISYLDIKRKQFLEYDLATILVKFTKGKKAKRIGILTDLDLGNETQMPAFIRELLKQYDIDIIPMTYPVFPMYDLVISFATPFSEPASLYAADQYLVKGGKMLMFFDPFFRTAPESDFLLPDRRADARVFDHLADLLRFYGVDYDYNSILGDKTRAISTNVPGVGLTSYPLWTMFSETEMNKNHPIFANLSNIIIPEGGYFTNNEILPSLTFTPLLTSTKHSQTVTRALFNSVGDPKAVASRMRGEKKQRPFAIMLDGHFMSAFKHMPKEVKAWFKSAQSLDEVKKYPDHVNFAEDNNKGVLIAIADMDFMADQFSTYGERNIDGSIDKKPISDNQFFLTNTIDYLMGDYDLIALRGKGDSLRTLRKIEDLIIDDIAKKDFQENALVRNIETTKQQYKTLNDRLKITKTTEEYIEVKKLIEEKELNMVLARRQLKHYKRSIKETVDTYVRKVALFNILFAPVLLLLIGSIYFIRRKLKFINS